MQEPCTSLYIHSKSQELDLSLVSSRTGMAFYDSDDKNCLDGQDLQGDDLALGQSHP